MIKKLLFAISIAIASSANAWDWFGLAPYDESNTNRPPRLHRLMEKANDLIEQAEDEALNGDGDKALGFYREALDELKRVERENPERAEKPEFAPLRNKKATCMAAIESIRFAQINDNLRAITVSDSAELRKKFRKKHGKEIGIEDFDVSKRGGSEEAGGGSGAKGETKDGEWRVRLKQAYGFVKARDYAAANVILEEILEERPTDLEALLLRAAAQCGTGGVQDARSTLEKACKAHPKSYVPHYNLAYVALELGEGEAAARKYYELGRSVGGPQDVNLEAILVLKKGVKK